MRKNVITKTKKAPMEGMLIVLLFMCQRDRQ